MNRNKKILIIEDDERDQSLLQYHLRAAGYQTLIFRGYGKEGILVAETEKPHIIIIDANLPDMDGNEVCRCIRTLPNYHPRIIITTGHVDFVDGVKARSSGADDCVVKTADCACIMESLQSMNVVSF